MSFKAVRCDVYSRVCGYYTPTNVWNKGKKAEFADRQSVDISDRPWPALGKKEPAPLKLVVALVS